MSPMLDYDEMELDSSVEPKVLPKGTECKVIITTVKSGEDKNNLDYYLPTLEVVGEPYVKEFTHFLHVPNKALMGDKQLNRTRFALNSFVKCFGIDTSRPSNPEDSWPGCEGFVILGVSKSEEYGEQNFVKTLVLPR